MPLGIHQKGLNIDVDDKIRKKKHLEQLKRGIVHFSSLEVFQDDPTSFRGDHLEGKLLLDPTKQFCINGVDISSMIKEATITYITDCPQFSFSAAMLSTKNCHQLPDGLFTVNESFVQEMQQFGDCFLLINAFEFTEALVEEFNRTQCPFEYHPISYIDKHHHQLIQEHFEKLSKKSKKFGHLFIKDAANNYPLQNEWRFIVFDVQNHYGSKNGGGVNIQTGFLTQMPVMETQNLCTLRCSEEYLFH